ncbi:MAG: hypothetical protein PHP65_00220 [Bacilli bacterium]|nr:hypothetical protein [Bacilli bacterium]
MSIYHSIQSLVSFSAREEDIFRAFANSFSSIGDPLELHGTKYRVSFNNPLDVTKNVSCEISDLLLFVYKGTTARFTFLQNKKAKNTSYVPNGYNGIPLRQRHLLGDFPLITAVNKKIYFPPNLFSSRTLDSIGSLGVFYIDSSHKINMDYSVMNLMQTTGIYNSVDYDGNHNRTFSFSGKSSNIRLVKGYYEIESCSNLIDFESNILKLVIGEPITNNNYSISEFILSVVEKAIEENECRFASLDDIKIIRKEHGITKDNNLSLVLKQPQQQKQPNLKIVVINCDKVEKTNKE